MAVASGGSLWLHFQKDPIAAYLPLLQKGFYIEIPTDNLLETLCRTCGLEADQIRKRIQTLFLNGKPVDDVATASVQDGDCLALSAAMPGLVGAVMRSGGVLAGLRQSISHQPDQAPQRHRGGILSVKLFNLLIREIGPRFLEQGILVRTDDLDGLLKSLAQADWDNCRTAQWNQQPIRTEALKRMDWPMDSPFIRLQITFG
jgi:hypothetical protein